MGYASSSNVRLLVVGAGIFVLSGKAAAQYAGPSVIISFIVSGIVALLAALSFSELMGMMPVSGAAFTYTYAGQCANVGLHACRTLLSSFFQL